MDRDTTTLHTLGEKQRKMLTLQSHNISAIKPTLTLVLEVVGYKVESRISQNLEGEKNMLVLS